MSQRPAYDGSEMQIDFWSDHASKVVAELIARRAWLAWPGMGEQSSRLSALPVGYGFGNEYYLRASGEVIDIEISSDRCDQMFYIDRSTTLMALRMGSRFYSELLGLIPSRPCDAVDCETCKEFIKFPGGSSVHCDQCGSLRWLLPRKSKPT